jgi:nucleoside-diphosphate-sugar epimerase
MRVLVTGAAGFLGSHVVRRCVRAGCEVAALVRPGSDLARIIDIADRVTLVEADLRSDAAPEAIAAARPDVCIHAAWHVAPGRYPQAIENLDSVAASAALLRALASTECGRTVFVGSCLEYAPSSGCMDETSPVGPRTLYGGCKLAVSIMLEQLAREKGRSAATARLFNLYGPYEAAGRLVPAVIHALRDGRSCALTSGTQTRDFLHIADAADGVWTVAESGLEGAVNVASGTPATVADLARELARQLGRPDLLQLGARPLPSDEPTWLCAKPGRLHRTGWVPQYDLARGLEHTIEWWRHRRDASPVSALSQQPD